MEALDAVKYQQQVDVEVANRQASSERHVLLETLKNSIDGMVTDLMAPLRALPNPFA
jgi:hypothetical protein